ncbi:MAG TPA: hypothetical protein VJ828_10955 [Lacipirellulaceae bacterium]|nr:hypothetical protein [Lacipirellulaceae bacterium]
MPHAEPDRHSAQIKREGDIHRRCGELHAHVAQAIQHADDAVKNADERLAKLNALATALARYTEPDTF